MPDFIKLLDVIRQNVRGKISPRHRARFGTSDVSQECAIQLIKEFQNRSDDQPPPQITNAWLAKIAFGHAARLRKREVADKRAVNRETAQANGTLVSKSDTPANLAENKEITSLLLHELSELPPVESEIIRRHYQERESLSSIASSVGLERKKVQRLHRQIIVRLRSRLMM